MDPQSPQDQTQNPLPPAPDDAGLGGDNANANAPSQPPAGDAGTPPLPTLGGTSPAGDEPAAPADESPAAPVGGVADEPAGEPAAPGANEVEREQDTPAPTDPTGGPAPGV